MSLPDTGLRVGGDGHDPGIRLVLSRKTMVSGTVSKFSPHQVVGLATLDPVASQAGYDPRPGQRIFPNEPVKPYEAAGRGVEITVIPK